MRLESHIPASAGISIAVYFISKSPAMSISCFLAGILIDLDHIYDYFVETGFNLNIKHFFHKHYTHDLEKYFLFLHSYELMFIMILAALFIKSDVYSGVVIGFTSHVIMDSLINPIYFRGYFLFYRIKIKFSSRLFKERLAKMTKTGMTKDGTDTRRP